MRNLKRFPSAGNLPHALALELCMIHGLGTDIVSITRIAALLARFPDAFPSRILGSSEQERYWLLHARNPRHALHFLAKRFAAKEACAKALGTGFRNGLRFHDIEVLNDANGKPSLIFSERARALFSSLHTHRFHLSLSDDDPYALAVVVVETTSPSVL